MSDIKQYTVYAKLTPEELDAFIKERIHRSGNINPRESNKQRMWTDAEKAMRNQAILSMVADGYSRPMISKELQARWEINKTTANRYIRESLESLVEDNEEFIKHARDIAISRLEGVMMDAKEHGDRKSFLSALDQYNKIHALYTEKHEVKEDVSISFDFGKD